MIFFCFILLALSYFQLTWSMINTSDIPETFTEENNLWAIKSVVIPLLDIGVLWAEDRLVRSKRNPDKLTSENSVGFVNSINRQTKKGNQTDSSDAFVDSLVSLMSKSDPALLLKLQKRIETFEENRPRNSKSFRQDKQRPLIQFFNVTKISVSSGDDDVVNPKNEENVIQSKSEEQKVKSDLEDNDSELSAKTDTTTLLKTKDGKIAKIQRSRDKKRYRLEIDCSTMAPLEDANENEDVEAERKKRKVKILNQASVTERYLGYLQGVIGSCPDDSFVKHSFPFHQPYNA